jgi:hypothetical protein
MITRIASCGRRLSMTPNTRMSIPSFTLNGDLASFVTTFSERDTPTYVRVAKQQKTYRMPKTWWTCFTEPIHRSDTGNEMQQLSFGTRTQRKGITWTISFPCLCFPSLLLFVWPCTNRLAIGFTTIRSKSCGGGVSPWFRFGELS